MLYYYMFIDTWLRKVATRKRSDGFIAYPRGQVVLSDGEYCLVLRGRWRRWPALWHRLRFYWRRRSRPAAIDAHWFRLAECDGRLIDVSRFYDFLWRNEPLWLDSEMQSPAG